MRFLWDQLAASKPIIKSVSDAKLVSTHRERTRLHQFLMGVLDDFESVRSQLLNRSPLPTVNQAVFCSVESSFPRYFQRQRMCRDWSPVEREPRVAESLFSDESAFWQRRQPDF
jgi:hypothetical protein